MPPKRVERSWSIQSLYDIGNLISSIRTLSQMVRLYCQSGIGAEVVEPYGRSNFRIRPSAPGVKTGSRATRLYWATCDRASGFQCLVALT